MTHSWKIGWKSGWGDSSLVPTPREREEEKGPGYHSSRMRLIAVNFHRLRGPWTNVDRLYAYKRQNVYSTFRGP